MAQGRTVPPHAERPTKISVSDNDVATCSEDECDTTTEDSDEDSDEGP